MAKKEKINITQDFVDQCTEVLAEYGAVRKDSFRRFIELSLDVSPDTAEDIIAKFEIRNDIYEASYADTTIVKKDNIFRAKYKDLDAFDAYLAVLADEKADGVTSSVISNRAAFPADFVTYSMSGRTYSTFIYDEHLAQRLSIFDRKYDNKLKEHVKLIVFPVGTNLSKAAVPRIEGAYKLAVVRRTASGATDCKTTDIRDQAENEKKAGE